MHSCPVCDQACYCGGDIDDIDTGDEEAGDNCDHCVIGNPDREYDGGIDEEPWL